MSEAELRRTPLYSWHAAHGGRMVGFGGWSMPVQYEAGPRAVHQRVQTWDVARLGPGRAHYAMLPRPDGGVLDDIFVYRLHAGWLLVVNASNRARDVAHLEAAAAGFDARLRDLSDATGMIALQGPAARRVLARLAPEAELPAYHRVARLKVGGVESTVCATGPCSAGLDGVAVRMSGHDFIGKSALASIAAAGPARGQIGAVSTGLFSLSTGQYVEMGYVEAPAAEAGTAIRIVIRDTRKGARIVARPFYRSPNWR